MSWVLTLPSDLAIVAKKLDLAETEVLVALEGRLTSARPSISEEGFRKLLGPLGWKEFSERTLPRLVDWGFLVEMPDDPSHDVEIMPQKFRIKFRHTQVETFEIEACNAEDAVSIVERGEQTPQQSVDFWEGEGDVFVEGDEDD
jgi:hypothetical protein